MQPNLAELGQLPKLHLELGVTNQGVVLALMPFHRWHLWRRLFMKMTVILFHWGEARKKKVKHPYLSKDVLSSLEEDQRRILLLRYFAEKVKLKSGLNWAFHRLKYPA